MPVAPVLNRPEMLALAHLRERGVATSDPWADPAIGYPVRFAQHPAARDVGALHGLSGETDPARKGGGREHEGESERAHQQNGIRR